ncbi:hypothetical protein SLI_8052 [Streptomyces lividans 1326]|uniref:Uncharacterized protein n=1 Tax=Streptomyces lividans 1326 TaxID=1200984 RepID=A0A7U9HFK1_STRLI|nr:hypothetical protein SLI_8052 [Streptomyces lividans 1326]
MLNIAVDTREQSQQGPHWLRRREPGAHRAAGEGDRGPARVFLSNTKSSAPA